MRVNKVVSLCLAMFIALTGASPSSAQSNPEWAKEQFERELGHLFRIMANWSSEVTPASHEQIAKERRDFVTTATSLRAWSNTLFQNKKIDASLKASIDGRLDSALGKSISVGPRRQLLPGVEGRLRTSWVNLLSPFQAYTLLSEAAKSPSGRDSQVFMIAEALLKEKDSSRSLPREVNTNSKARVMIILLAHNFEVFDSALNTQEILLADAATRSEAEYQRLIEIVQSEQVETILERIAYKKPSVVLNEIDSHVYRLTLYREHFPLHYCRRMDPVIYLEAFEKVNQGIWSIRGISTSSNLEVETNYEFVDSEGNLTIITSKRKSTGVMVAGEKPFSVTTISAKSCSHLGNIPSSRGDTKEH